MGFLNGLLLFGAIGALVPLVIHLLERRRVPRLDFPSLRFLTELNRRQMRRLNLRRLLLLALRMLLVITVAFALARPTLMGPLAALFPEDTPRAVALLLDNSASMAWETESGTLAELAVDRAREILSELNEDDEVLLYALEEQAFDRGGGPVPPSLARELLSDWPVGEGATALRAGIARARSELALRPHPQKELYILSDFAAASLSDAAADTTGGTDLVQVFALPLSTGAVVNAGLVDIQLPVRPVLPGRPFNLGVAARLQAGGSVEPFPVELELADKHRGSLQLSPEAEGPAWRELSVSLEEEGLVTGVWRKKRDRFAPDDALPFSLSVAPRLRVLLLASPESAPDAGQRAGRLGLADHLARALDPYRGSRPEELALDLEILPLERLASASLENRHLVVLAGGAGLGETRGELLAGFVAAGGGLIVCPNETGLGDLVRHLLPRLDGPRSLEKVADASEKLAQIDPEHPLFVDFSEEHRRVLAEQPLWRIFRTRPGSREVLARFASGRPAMLAWPHGQGRMRLLLFEAGPEGGELPYSSMFLPLVHEMVQEAAGGSRPQWARVGDSLSWPLPSQSDAETALHVLAPGERRLPLRIDASQRPPRAILERADRSGFYWLVASGSIGERRLGLAAVRVPAEEGRLEPLPADSLAAALGLPGLQVLRGDAPLAAALAEGRFGKEIALPLLILAALLMAAELWLGQREGQTG